MKKAKRLPKSLLVLLLIFLAPVLGVYFFLSKKALVPDSANSAPCIKMTIPAYFRPGALWDQLNAQTGTVDNIIANPRSGPGVSPSTTYVSYIKKTQNAHIKVLGYVHTSYGARDIALVKDEIDKYNNWYKVNGIFLDEVSNKTANLSYYDQIANYIRRTSGSVVMINPGTTPTEDYIKLADISVVFEGEYSTYQNRTFPSWISNYPPTKFAHLVYNVPDVTAMRDVVTKAKNRNAGYLFVTNGTQPSPWNILPSYWTEEIAAMKLACGQVSISPSATPTSTPSLQSPEATATGTVQPSASPGAGSSANGVFTTLWTFIKRLFSQIFYFLTHLIKS